MVILSTVLALVAVLLAGAGCRSMGRSFGSYVEDKAVSTRLKVKLLAARPQPLKGINVDTFEGTVYLSGVVESEEVKGQAEALARRIEGVDRVINDLHVRGAAAGSASPPLESLRQPALATSFPPHPLLVRLPGLDRLDPPAADDPAGGRLAYDRSGRLVATVYTVSMRELAQHGFENLQAARPIDHVSIYPVLAHPDVPDPHYHIVLWHVSRLEASALGGPAARP